MLTKQMATEKNAEPEGPGGGGRLFIVAEARSGSSWLYKTLNSHPDIGLYGELLNARGVHRLRNLPNDPLPGDAPRLAAIEETLLLKKKPWLGFKILTHQFAGVSPDFFRSFLDYYPNGHYIFLIRENTVLARISLAIAQRYGVWHLPPETPAIKRKVTIRPEMLLEFLEMTDRRRGAMLGEMEQRKLRVFRTSYERLFEQRERELEGILSFLELRLQTLVFNGETKGNPFRPSEVLENYAAVEEFLGAHPRYHGLLSAAETGG